MGDPEQDSDNRPKGSRGSLTDAGSGSFQAPILREVLRPGLRLVFCGSAPGKRSALLSEYYAGPGNRFWPTLAEIGLTPKQLSPSEFELLLTYGIGLTDLVVHEAGNDADITFSDAARERLEATILAYAPAYVCFNGKRSAKEYLQERSVHYGLQSRRIGTTQLFVAPSTSGAARRSWDLSPWQELASLVRR